MSAATYWLSFHAAYACRHAGACCTSRWPIPIETGRARLVRAATADGRVSVADPWLATHADAPEGTAGLLEIDAAGHCVFHQHDRCAIHGALGHGALPSACQHFPRVCLIDPRGVFVTLSHYCPTAASMLFDVGPVSIVEGPPALPGDASPEGLDAREAWPPLLTDHVLMDHESYAAWERHMVETLAGENGTAGSPEAALAQLRADAEAIARWRPGQGALIDVVRRHDVGRPEGRPLRSHAGDLVERQRSVSENPPSVSVLFDVVRRAVPLPLMWPEAPREVDREWRARVEPGWLDWSSVIRRYLAAHAFASWMAYQGRGIVSVVRALEAALAVLEVELARACLDRGSLDRATLTQAIRQADLLLRHHADRQALARQA